MIEAQFQTKICIVHPNNRTEFFNYQLTTFLHDKGIFHQATCCDTPQKNGIAKQQNKHLLELLMPLCFLCMFQNMWGDAILTVAYLINECQLRCLILKLL